MTAVCFHQSSRDVHPGAEDHGEQDEDDTFVPEPEGVQVAADAMATAK